MISEFNRRTAAKPWRGVAFRATAGKKAPVLRYARKKGAMSPLPSATSATSVSAPIASRSPRLTLCAPKCERPPMSTAGAHPFDAVARAQADALFAFAMRLSGDSSEARDLVQDTFERALRRFDQLAPGSNVRAWLFTILHNGFIDRCRSRKAAPRTESVDVVDPPASEKIGPSLSMTITSTQLRVAIDRLEADFRIVYVKHAIEGRSYADISAELGVPVNTIGTRLARARRKLRTTLIAMVGAEGADRDATEEEGES